MLIEDNIITLNSNVTGTPSENAGVEIERGTSANTQILWNEGTDKWTFTNDGSLYYDIPTDFVGSFNGRTGAVQGVSAAVAGTGISVSGATGAVTITNIGVQSFNGLTGAVTGVTVGGTNIFTALNTFNAGISSAGGTFTSRVSFSAGLSAAGITTGTITSIVNIYGKDTGNTAGLTLWADPNNFSNPVYISLSRGGGSDSGTVNIQAGTLNLRSATSLLGENPSIVMEVYDVGSSVYRKAEIGGGSITANRTYSFPDASGDFIVTGNIASNAVTSFNGNVGAVQGVSAAVAGTGIAVNGATGAVTITNIGVQSFNGRTGAVQGVSAAVAGDGISVSGATGSVTITNIGVTRAVAGTGISISANTGTVTITNIGVQSFNGLTGAVTGASLGTNTFTALNTFNAGISSAGGTFSSLTRFTAGLSAAGITTSSLRVTGTSTFDGDISASTIRQNGASSLYIQNDLDTIYIGDGLGEGNGTYFTISDQSTAAELSTGAFVIGAYTTCTSPDQTAGAALTVNTDSSVFGAGNCFQVTNFFDSSTPVQVNAAGAMTLTGRLTASGGISAAGGMTLNGTMSLNGQTFTNLVSTVNGITGSISSLRAPAGLTSSIGVFTFPNGVTSYSATSTPYYTSPYYGVRAVSTGNMVANRTYWVLQQTPRNVSIKNIRVAANSPSVSGNVYFSVWSVNPDTGLPATRLYSSPAPGVTATASVFNYVTLTNASGLVNVPAGPFYIAATFSTALPTYMHSTDRGLAIYGSANYVTGYMNYLPVLDSSGFTAPTSINQAGTTFGFIDYYPTSVTVPVLEWNHV